MAQGMRGPTALQWMPELDGVRGLAIAAVLAVHCLVPQALSPVSSVLRQVLGLGWAGVDLFFVLSGYLITRILLAARGESDALRDFYGRRALRILPAYYFTLALIVGFGPMVGMGFGNDVSPWALAGFVFYCQNWIMGFSASAADWTGVAHFWSLAIEEQFYLFWPWIVLRLPFGTVRRLCLWLLALGMTMKLAFVLLHAPKFLVYGSTLTRGDGLLFGALIAYLPQQASCYWRRGFAGLAMIGAAGLATLALLHRTHDQTLIAMIGVTSFPAWVFAGLVYAIHVGTLKPPLQRLLSGTVLRWLGRYSYGIYLLHFPINAPVSAGVRAVLPENLPMNLLVAVTGIAVIAISLLAAYVMYQFIERPCLNLRRHWQGPSAATTPPAVALRS